VAGIGQWIRMIYQAKVRAPRPRQPENETVLPCQRLAARGTSTREHIKRYDDPSDFRDADLANVEGMDQLEQVSIKADKVTDAGLLHLRDLNTLKVLGLQSTSVTADGVRRLRQALPNCDIREDVDP
jgi:hypothetical protein